MALDGGWHPGRGVYAQGRYEEVEPYLRMCEETAASEDAYSQSLLRSVRAKLLARQGEAETAEELGRQAVTVTVPTDFLFMRGFALLSLGETLQLGGRMREAQAVLQEAIGVCEQKGFTVGARRARQMMSEARPGPA